MIDLSSIAFWVLAVITVGGSLMVVFSRNPIVGALFLALSFLGGAGLFILLHAHFLALIQVLIYAGAIVVLFIYVVMLLDLSPRDFKGTYSLVVKVFALAIGLLLVFGFVFILFDFKGMPFSQLEPGYPGIMGLADALFTKYVIPFELVSIVLLIGIIGAVMLIKKIPRKRDGEEKA